MHMLDVIRGIEVDEDVVDLYNNPPIEHVSEDIIDESLKY